MKTKKMEEGSAQIADVWFTYDVTAMRRLKV